MVVLNYNDWPETERCLESLKVLDYPNYQLLVVDNGSSDRPPRELTRHFPSLVLLRNSENLGFAGGNNLGIHHALKRGADYVWLLNNDTRAEQGSLRAMVEIAEKDAQVGAVGSIILNGTKNLRMEAWGGGQVNFLTGLPSHFKGRPSGRTDYLCGASLLLRGHAMKCVGMLDEGFFLYWEDTDLCFRMRAHGWKLGVAETARIIHRGSHSTVFQSLSYDFHFTASSIRFFRRHARLWLMPSLISAAGRMVRRFLSAKPANAKAAWHGFVSGLSRSLKERKP